jgi:hypothetical protein
MSTLTIEFRQMFLLINRTNGATVLIPSQGHSAELSGTILEDIIPLKQAEVTVRRDGADLADKPTLRPGAKFLPYLDSVFHVPVAPLPEVKTVTVPDTLNAKVNLAGGFLTELPASQEKYADVMWTFRKPKGEETLTQQLTDRLLFTLPLEEGVAYKLIVKSGGSEQTWDIPPTGAAFVLLNKDTGPVKTRVARDGGETQLVEYSILYNLTDAKRFMTLYPIPTATINSVGGGDAPICGGGQGDGDDDPPPPPPPGR